ncbi:YceD family protein [Desulfohalobium retbaense]|uniref:DUF177 domain-containing protein n=1 Tax=Desulfohalobium retbaense (strain ATCC 49708 / DSM 5692 / JCM 16813 / HR100) TaxID=485915 RepID=C8X2Q1_DESRD|nr:DUF177 domain-containing protein [Desulfohalobium retbaense]ACV68698.1 protein of unknown function DUF177 [Desulfohalobium retbaense DSM 5692]
MSTTHWVTITNLPADGREFTFTEQSIWSEPLQEFGLPWRIVEPLRASVFLLPQKDGCYIRGSLKGELEMACHRCAEPARVPVHRDFELFEQLPDEEADDLEALTPGFLRENDEILELDVAGILWEELQLAVPDKVLCAAECLGLCPHCGANLNTNSCDCASEEGDPRMAVFRKLKVH